MSTPEEIKCVKCGSPDVFKYCPDGEHGDKYAFPTARMNTEQCKKNGKTYTKVEKCVNTEQTASAEIENLKKRVERMKEALQTARDGFDELGEYELECTGEDTISASYKALITPTVYDPF